MSVIYTDAWYEDLKQMINGGTVSTGAAVAVLE